MNDDAEGIRLVLRHLDDRGHRRIARIAGSKAISTGELRFRTFRQEALEQDLDLPEEAVAISWRFDEDEGSRCATDLQALGWPSIAISCTNDRLAQGAIDALHRRGLSFPDDASITGFNDLPFLGCIPLA